MTSHLLPLTMTSPPMLPSLVPAMTGSPPASARDIDYDHSSSASASNEYDVIATRVRRFFSEFPCPPPWKPALLTEVNSSKLGPRVTGIITEFMTGKCVAATIPAFGIESHLPEDSSSSSPEVVWCDRTCQLAIGCSVVLVAMVIATVALVCFTRVRKPHKMASSTRPSRQQLQLSTSTSDAVNWAEFSNTQLQFDDDIIYPPFRHRGLPSPPSLQCQLHTARDFDPKWSCASCSSCHPLMRLGSSVSNPYCRQHGYSAVYETIDDDEEDDDDNNDDEDNNDNDDPDHATASPTSGTTSTSSSTVVPTTAFTTTTSNRVSFGNRQPLPTYMGNVFLPQKESTLLDAHRVTIRQPMTSSHCTSSSNPMIDLNHRDSRRHHRHQHHPLQPNNPHHDYLLYQYRHRKDEKETGFNGDGDEIRVSPTVNNSSYPPRYFELDQTNTNYDQTVLFNHHSPTSAFVTNRSASNNLKSFRSSSQGHAIMSAPVTTFGKNVASPSHSTHTSCSQLCVTCVPNVLPTEPPACVNNISSGKPMNGYIPNGHVFNINPCPQALLARVPPTNNGGTSHFPQHSNSNISSTCPERNNLAQIDHRLCSNTQSVVESPDGASGTSDELNNLNLATDDRYFYNILNQGCDGFSQQKTPTNNTFTQSKLQLQQPICQIPARHRLSKHGDQMEASLRQTALNSTNCDNGDVNSQSADVSPISAVSASSSLRHWCPTCQLVPLLDQSVPATNKNYSHSHSHSAYEGTENEAIANNISTSDNINWNNNAPTNNDQHQQHYQHNDSYPSPHHPSSILYDYGKMWANNLEPSNREDIITSSEPHSSDYPEDSSRTSQQSLNAFQRKSHTHTQESPIDQQLHVDVRLASTDIDDDGLEQATNDNSCAQTKDCDLSPSVMALHSTYFDNTSSTA